MYRHVYLGCSVNHTDRAVNFRFARNPSRVDAKCGDHLPREVTGLKDRLLQKRPAFLGGPYNSKMVVEKGSKTWGYSVN